MCRAFEELIEQGIEIGREEGIEIGREEGIELGREEGIELGREEGIELGIEQGAMKKTIELVKRMMEMNHMSLEEALFTLNATESERHYIFENIV